MFDVMISGFGCARLIKFKSLFVASDAPFVIKMLGDLAPSNLARLDYNNLNL